MILKSVRYEIAGGRVAIAWLLNDDMSHDKNILWLEIDGKIDSDRYQYIQEIHKNWGKKGFRKTTIELESVGVKRKEFKKLVKELIKDNILV